MKNRNLMPLILCFAACLTFLLAGTPPAHGQAMARFEVTSARDEPDLSPGDYKCLSISGECTLRAAVEQANYYGGGPHTIVLRDEIYVLEDPLTIEAHLRIYGKTGATGLDCKDVPSLRVTGALEVWDLAIRHCPETENRGRLDLYSVVLEENTGATALRNYGGLLVAFSTLRGNRAVAPSSGGAALVNEAGGYTHIAESTLEGNVSETDGGAVLNRGKMVIVIGEFLRNIATGAGGALLNIGDVRIELVTFDRNEALQGGALYNRGQLESIRTGFVANRARTQGGAIWSDAPLQLVNSTVSGNSAPHGGGLYGRGEPNVLWLANATITRNAASPTENEPDTAGGGLYGAALLRNTILAENTSLGRGQDCYATAVTPRSEGHNIIGIQDDCNLTLERSDRAGSQRKPLSPRLRPLDATTWWPPFHALEAQSPAVDHGNPAGCNMPITDLRLDSDQLEKTRHQGAECDAGAVELTP